VFRPFGKKSGIGIDNGRVILQDKTRPFAGGLLVIPSPLGIDINLMALLAQ
jgi:hypothetical protein